MKYAIITDIHSNIQALQAADKLIKKIGVDEILCLGDIVGYNANPIECLEYIQSNKIRCVQGNHDVLCSEQLRFGVIKELHPDAVAGIGHSAELLSDDHKKWLLDLPRTIRIKSDGFNFLLSHGDPSVEWGGAFGYVLSIDEARTTLAGMVSHKSNLCFFGHTHLPTFLSTESSEVFPRRSDVDFFIRKAVGFGAEEEGLGINDMVEQIFDVSECKTTKRIAINVGTIGQPRGIHPSFGIFDTKKKTVTIQYFDYNIKEAQNAILKAGYSKHIAERLGDNGKE